ncbi:MAG: hypothetical protein QNK40_14995 [Desulfobacterales bacterium]|nr:hypothetical protein [Desulfobacterales bacterium]
MNVLQKSDAWLTKLKDQVGKAKIVLRLERAANGNSLFPTVGR